MRPAVQPDVAITQGRGVYRGRRVRGRWVYYAVTSTGAVLEPMRPRHDETDAEIVVRLTDRLDRVDPVLRLVSADRSPSSERPTFWMHGLLPLVREPGRPPRLTVSGRSSD